MSQYFQVLLRLSSHNFAADRGAETSETSSDGRLSATALTTSQGKDEAPHLLATQKNHRARYSLKDTSESYTVFISQYGPANRQWRADGQPPVLMNLGMMPVFINVQEGAAVSFTRWKWLVALEAVALWVTLMCLVYLWPRILKSTGLRAVSCRLRIWVVGLTTKKGDGH